MIDWRSERGIVRFSKTTRFKQFRVEITEREESGKTVMDQKIQGAMIGEE